MLQTFYRAVVVARLLYAASAWNWWRFTNTSADRQHLGHFCAVAFVPITAVRMSWLPSWSKTQMTSCSTGSSTRTSAATFCSYCFLAAELTLMHCEIGHTTFYYPTPIQAQFTNWLAFLLLDNFLTTLTDFHTTLLGVFYVLTFVVFICSIFAYVKLLQFSGSGARPPEFPVENSQ